jgi:hypothetical protein
MSENDQAGTGPQPVQDELTEAEREFMDAMGPEQWDRFEKMLETQRQGRQPQEVGPAERVLADPPDKYVLGLTMDQILAALETAVMVIRPGEVLVVRVPPWLTQAQTSNYQQSINEMLGWHGLSDIHVLVLPGEEFSKIKPSPETLQALLSPRPEGFTPALPPAPPTDLRPTMAEPVEPPPTGPQPVQE